MSDSIDPSTRDQDKAERADAARVQAFLRARARVRSGPFAILISPSDAGLYANYAVPDDDAQPTAADIAALEQAFQIRGRTARLECAPGAAVAVEAALIAAGFSIELRPPLMICNAGAVRPVPPLEDFDLAFTEDEVDLSKAASVQAEVYDGDPDDFQWLRDMPGRGGASRWPITAEPARWPAWGPSSAPCLRSPRWWASPHGRPSGDAASRKRSRRC